MKIVCKFFAARELGSGAFGKVFLADAMGIVAFDPRGSTKRKSTRRRFGGSVRRNHSVNNNKMAKVAVKTLKGIFSLTMQKVIVEKTVLVILILVVSTGRKLGFWLI